MTKKEFLAAYAVKRTQKNMRVISDLAKTSDLSIFNYCNIILSDADIYRYGGRSKDTIRDWKKKDVFAYQAFREKSVRCMIKELENGVVS